jgi:hypothetical protein
MARFVALPVGQGDAFYLDRGDWSVLIDGGRAQRSFGTSFQTITGAGAIDVLVCTHNDADHANGVLGFLESGLECGEVWLPGRWLGALPSVLRPFVEVFVQLADEVAQEEMGEHVQRPPVPGTTPLERFAEGLAEAQRQQEPEEGAPLGEDGWPKVLLEELEQEEPWDWDGWLWSGYPEDWPHPFYPHPWYLWMGPAQARLLWSAIEAARKVRAIAIAAFHRGIPVRWFEYDVTAPGGGRAELQPLNARAIAHVRPVVGPLLRALALTVTNKESLVFWSPPTDSIPGVLFNADSDLNKVQLPGELAGAISTAPHHGSEGNANAYSTVAAAAGRDAASLTWVRSDGRYRSRPGSSYLSVAGRRLCTMCRLAAGTSSTKRAVRLFARGGRWTRHRKTPRECACR